MALSSENIDPKLAKAQHLAVIKTAPVYVIIAPQCVKDRAGKDLAQVEDPWYYYSGISPNDAEGRAFWAEIFENLAASLRQKPPSSRRG